MKFKNNKGITLVETIISILILSIVTISILNILQTGKNIRYELKSNQDIFNIHENLINYIDMKNMNIKKNISKGVYNFNTLSRNEFLKLFPSNNLNTNLNSKDCYSITSSGKEFIFNKIPIDLDGFVKIDSNLSIDINGKNINDSEYGYSYPTVLCISNTYDIIDNINSNKTNNGPILVTIFSNYIISGEVKTISNEKKIYFDEK